MYFYARKNDRQLRATNPAILTENIKPGFVNQYINLLQAFNSFRVSRNNETLNSFINEFDRLETLKPSFFADSYRLYGDVMTMQGNFSFARNLYNKAIATDSLSVLSYLGISNTYNYKTDGEILSKYQYSMENLSLVQTIQ